MCFITFLICLIFFFGGGGCLWTETSSHQGRGSWPQLHVSQSARLWKPDNPLMESTGAYCCLYTLHLPFRHIWRFIEGEGWAAGVCTNMAGHDGNRKGGRKNLCRGRHTGGWWELLWPAYRGHYALVSLPWSSDWCGGQTIKGPLFCLLLNKKSTSKQNKGLSWRQQKVSLTAAKRRRLYWTSAACTAKRFYIKNRIFS